MQTDMPKHAKAFSVTSEPRQVVNMATVCGTDLISLCTVQMILLQALSLPCNAATCGRHISCNGGSVCTYRLHMYTLQLWAFRLSLSPSHMPRDACCSGRVVDCRCTWPSAQCVDMPSAYYTTTRLAHCSYIVIMHILAKAKQSKEVASFGQQNHI